MSDWMGMAHDAGARGEEQRQMARQIEEDERRRHEEFALELYGEEEHRWELGSASGWSTVKGAGDTWNWHAYGVGGSRSGSADTPEDALAAAKAAAEELTNDQGER